MSVPSANSDSIVVRWFNKAARYLVGNGGFILVTIASVLLAVAPADVVSLVTRTSNDSSKHHQPAWLALGLLLFGVVLVGAGIVTQVRLKLSYSDLREASRRHAALADDAARAVREALESILRRLAKECSLHGTHQRVSICCAADQEFVLLARYSQSSRPTQSGRAACPATRGAVGTQRSLDESSHSSDRPCQTASAAGGTSSSRRMSSEMRTFT